MSGCARADQRGDGHGDKSVMAMIAICRCVVNKDCHVFSFRTFVPFCSSLSEWTNLVMPEWRVLCRSCAQDGIPVAALLSQVSLPP